MLPAVYFYAQDDMTAELLQAFHALPKAARASMLEAFKKAHR